jgi:uracil phosphoribosyltransferase
MPDNLFVSSHPLIAHKLTILRDKNTNAKQFRELIFEISSLLAYEALYDLPLVEHSVETPLTTAQGWEMQEKLGLVPILRAGLGMVEGIQNLVPQCEVWHLGLYRDEKTLEPVVYYGKLPETLNLSYCFVLDPMLATGGTATAAVEILKRRGVTKIKYLGILAAPEGIHALSTAYPEVPIHVAGVDDRLTTEADADKGLPPGFIWPGLGDAGDRQFGTFR